MNKQTNDYSDRIVQNFNYCDKILTGKIDIDKLNHAADCAIDQNYNPNNGGIDSIIAGDALMFRGSGFRFFKLRDSLNGDNVEYRKKIHRFEENNMLLDLMEKNYDGSYSGISHEDFKGFKKIYLPD